MRFADFRREYPFWPNLVQKIKVVSLSWNLVLRIISICRIQWWCGDFLLSAEISFLNKFDPILQNCLVKVKFSNCTHSNMQKSMVMLTFSLFGWKYPFCKIGPQNQNCQFKLKWGTYTNLNMQNSMVGFFLVLTRNILFGQNWSKNQIYQFKLKYGT